MRILCRHGFFSFYPESESDLARFCRDFEITLVGMDDFYTFPVLKNAPCFSIKGMPYLNTVSIKTFEGEPWEVMKENKLAYSIQGEIISPIAVFTANAVDIGQTNFNYIVEAALIQPGSIDRLGKVIASYDAHYDSDFKRLVLRGYWNE